jgi:hypothetical protein
VCARRDGRQGSASFTLMMMMMMMSGELWIALELQN